MKKLLIWGTGNIATEVYENSLNGIIVGFIETKKNKKNFQGIKVYELEERLQWPVYDYIVVANNYSDEILDICNINEINLEKVIFLRNGKWRFGTSDLQIISEILGEKNFTNYCVEFGLYQEGFYKEDWKIYEKLNTRDNFKINDEYLWPVITDKYKKAGNMGNYFWQDLWAARLIYRSGIKEHFDIGSRIDGFIAHLLAMDIDVSIIDVREFPGAVDGLHTIVDDATGLHQVTDESIISMSALCSLEHFGLGRYGDPIDPEACFKCFDQIQKKMKPNGNLYISLPIGKEKVEFNAHRVFYADTVVKCFHTMELIEFSCTAEGTIEYNVDLHKYDNDQHNGDFRYGLFHFKK